MVQFTYPIIHKITARCYVVLWNNVFHQSLKHGILDNRERLQILDNRCPYMFTDSFGTRIIDVIYLLFLQRYNNTWMHTRCSRLACAGDIFLCKGYTSRCFDKICFRILLVLWLVEHLSFHVIS